MKLKKGQILYINDIKYKVLNMVEYKEDTWIWQEYEIVGNTKRCWLTIEENENKQIEYWVYKPLLAYVNTDQITLNLNNKNYELYEKGKAKVKNYFGGADVDIGETCEYFDFISEDKKTIISVEKWQGETEKSMGTLIPNEKVRITEEIDKVEAKNQATSNKITTITLVLTFIVIPLIMIIISVIGSIGKNSIMNYLNDNKTKYEYITSVTSNTTNKKAKVYKSSFSTIDATVKDIIDGVPEGITKTIDSEEYTDEDGIGLETKSEYAYIYMENENVYIQVSDKIYVENSGTMYHSRRGTYYYRTYRSTNTSSEYTSYANSARQNSINSRKSSGGGTSSGK